MTTDTEFSENFGDATSNTSDEKFSLVLFYWVSKVYHVITSIISITAISYFVRCCKNYLKFNINILTHHLVVAIFARQPEDIVLNPLFYAILNIPFTISLFGTTSSLYLMVAERTLASYYFSFYEIKTKKIGSTMTSLAILIPICITVFILFDVRFDHPVISVIATQPSATLRINIIFVAHIFIYLITLVHSIILYRYNSRANGLKRSTTSLALSSKYRLIENETSSRILWQLVFAQTSIYLFYAISTFSIRIFFPRPRSSIWMIITEICYTPPIYCAIMPLLSIYTIRKSQKERNTRINRIVALSATGTEGWDNYQKMLRDQWA